MCWCKVWGNCHPSLSQWGFWAVPECPLLGPHQQGVGRRCCPRCRCLHLCHRCDPLMETCGRGVVMGCPLLTIPTLTSKGPWTAPPACSPFCHAHLHQGNILPRAPTPEMTALCRLRRRRRRSLSSSSSSSSSISRGWPIFHPTAGHPPACPQPWSRAGTPRPLQIHQSPTLLVLQCTPCHTLDSCPRWTLRCSYWGTNSPGLHQLENHSLST